MFVSKCHSNAFLSFEDFDLFSPKWLESAYSNSHLWGTWGIWPHSCGRLSRGLSKAQPCVIPLVEPSCVKTALPWANRKKIKKTRLYIYVFTTDAYKFWFIYVCPMWSDMSRCCRHGASERTQRSVFIPARVSEPTFQSQRENPRFHKRTFLWVIVRVHLCQLWCFGNKKFCFELLRCM